jgi:hypothetical protein
VVKNVLKEAIDKGVKNNMSCIFVCLDNLYTQYTYQDVRNISRTLDVIMQVECDQFYNEFIHKKFYIETNKREIISHTSTPQIAKKKGFTCCGLFG